MDRQALRSMCAEGREPRSVEWGPAQQVLESQFEKDLVAGRDARWTVGVIAGREARWTVPSYL